MMQVDPYGVKDAACPLSTRGGGGGIHAPVGRVFTHAWSMLSYASVRPTEPLEGGEEGYGRGTRMGNGREGGGGRRERARRAG